jgi:hypothetical protein
MASLPVRDPIGDHLLTPQNSALFVLDYQPFQFAGVQSIDRDLLLENIVSTVKIAKPYEQAQTLLDRIPGFVFSAAGPVHVSHDLGLLSFNPGVPEQPPAVSGVDVALVRDGRIARLYTLLTAQS